MNFLGVPVWVNKWQAFSLFGGLTNELYICTIPGNYSTNNKEKKQVVLRIYGPLYDDLVSSSSALISDIVVFALLSERNVGPKLYAIFPEGRLEELVNGKSLRREEMAQPDISVRIAQRMAEYHRLELPLCKEPDFMWNTMQGWCQDVEEMHLNEQDKAVILAKVREMDLVQEYLFLRNYLEKLTFPGPVTFCHNDVQEGNILKVFKERLRNNEEEIEAFDLANHFCEWMIDYTVAEPVYFSVALDKWPSKEQQSDAMDGALGKKRRRIESAIDEDSDAETVDSEARDGEESRKGWPKTCTKQLNHSEIEKRRRDKMNTYINELSTMIPMCNAMSRKLDKLTVLRLAVQHMKTLKGALDPFTETNYKPAFLSDEDLKNLLLETAEGFLFVVGCDRGCLLYASDSIQNYLNQTPSDLVGHSFLDLIHQKDISKVKEQLSSSDTTPRERLIDAKTGLPLKTENQQTPTRLCSGARRSFFCRMKCGSKGKKTKEGTQDTELCLMKRKSKNKQALDKKPYVVVHCTGYLKSWPPSGSSFDEEDEDNESRNLSCLVAELIGSSGYEFFHQEDLNAIAVSHRRTLEGETVTTDAYRFQCKGGHFVPIRTKSTVFRNPWSKELEFLVCVNTVITDLESLGIPASELRMVTDGAKSTGRNPRFSSSDSDGGVSNAGASRIGSMVAEQVQNQESHDRQSGGKTFIGNSNDEGAYETNVTAVATTVNVDDISPNAPGSSRMISGHGVGSSSWDHQRQVSQAHLLEQLIGMQNAIESMETPMEQSEETMSVFMNMLEADGGLGGEFEGLPFKSDS
ncbi:Aryl hydrocarbon receptor nuclear translocator-like protein 1 [Acropora cervicornis]|uniref:Aryl hydrocarbon receptor nuclear translocator-like protein 1 n=1 Tax=Acropora cervicornis TaxID=6130 RepID=A0AAD9QXV1_ACRCE|nr:Aryl hydrocarbon receptor nuclear translocator-like protein 1 [Acropora cervicornis]